MAAQAMKGESWLMRFLRARGRSEAVVVLVMFLIAVLQAGISYSVGQGPLRKFESTAFLVLASALYAIRIALLLLLVMLWVLNRKRALFGAIIAAKILVDAGTPR